VSSTKIETVRVLVGWTDGSYTWMPVAPGDYAESNYVVDVPKTTVEMWEALGAALAAQQRQLRQLDDLVNDRIEARGRAQGEPQP
jgi:hypothetical protein